MSDKDYVNIGTPEDKAIEEMGELLQAIGKAKRFGWLASHPERLDQNNITEARAEIKDVQSVLIEFDDYLKGLIR